jgi:uncharacterized protein YnzC (UPF0291/DUF896 family)
MLLLPIQTTVGWFYLKTWKKNFAGNLKKDKTIDAMGNDSEYV